MSVDTRTACCRDCRFFEPWETEDERTSGIQGECRRKSPAVRIGRPTHRRGGEMTPDEAIWPPVYANEWCGEFLAPVPVLAEIDK